MYIVSKILGDVHYITYYLYRDVPRRLLFIYIVPAFWDPVIRHCLDPDDSSGDVCFY